MELFIGFAIGMFYGCYLWWQTLLQGEELYREYLQVLRELQAARRRLYGIHGSRFADRGPTTKPSRN